MFCWEYNNNSYYLLNIPHARHCVKHLIYFMLFNPNNNTEELLI